MCQHQSDVNLFFLITLQRGYLHLSNKIFYAGLLFFLYSENIVGKFNREKNSHLRLFLVGLMRIPHVFMMARKFSNYKHVKTNSNGVLAKAENILALLGSR